MEDKPIEQPATEPRVAGVREAVVAAARELYSTAQIVINHDATEDDHYRVQLALGDMRDALVAHDGLGQEGVADVQSGAIEQEPWQVVRISEWLERLGVIHMGALAALAEAVGADRLHRIIGPAIGADLVSAGMLSRYEELGPTDEDGEAFIVYELTAAGAAAGLAWGKAMRHRRSND